MTNNLPSNGSTNWGSILNAFLQVAHNTDGSLSGPAVNSAGYPYLTQVYSVIQYGADPTGATDSTAAIQAAINAATGSANPQTTTRTPLAPVYFPAGTYKVTSDLIIRSVSGFKFVGAGINQVTLLASGTGFTQAVILIDGSLDGIFEGFQLKGDGTEAAGVNPIPDAIRLDWTTAANRSTSGNLFRDIRTRTINAVIHLSLEGTGTRQLDGTVMHNLVLTGRQTANAWVNTGASQVGIAFGNGSFGNNYDHVLTGVSCSAFYYGYKNNVSGFVLNGAQPAGNFCDFWITPGAQTTVSNVQSQNGGQFLIAPSSFSPLPNSFNDILFKTNYLSGTSNQFMNLIGGVWNFNNFSAANLVVNNTGGYVNGTINITGAASARPCVATFNNLTVLGPRTGAFTGLTNNPIITVHGYNNYNPQTGNYTVAAGDAASVYQSGAWNNLVTTSTGVTNVPAAKFDGATDDHAAINSAATANRTMLLPGGQAELGATVTIGTDGMTIRGQGMFSTTLQATAAINMMLYGGSWVSQITVEDMTLDGNNIATLGLAAYGSRIGRLNLRRCRFINFPGIVVEAGYAANYVIEDCIFEGGALGGQATTAFYAETQPFDSLIFRRNKIRYCFQGVMIGSSGFHASYVEIDDNDIDGAWWLFPSSAFTNSGGTVTYSSTGLTDTAAAFSGINVTGATARYARALPARVSSTFTSVTGTYVTDSSGNFITNGILRGEIIRSGSVYGVVSKVISATALHVEEWLSQTTCMPAAPPAGGATYTAYGVYLGTISAFTGTTLTVHQGAGGGGGGWFDLTGAAQTPASGTLYEVLNAAGAYPIYCDVVSEKILVTNNRVRRGRYDNMELFGNNMVITNNIVEDGQDEGIVFQGASTSSRSLNGIIANNFCHHNGASGIYVGNCDGVEITGNQCRSSSWTSPSTNNLGQITLSNASNVTLLGNRAGFGAESVNANIGLNITGASTSGIKSIGFTGTGHALGDIYVASTVPAGVCDLLDYTGTLTYQGTTNGQRLRTKGTGAPTMPASPGSLYQRTDGGVGTTVYIKEANNDNTQWDAVVSGVAPNVQFFTTTGTNTWNMPAGAVTVDVTILGGGGGGGSGALTAASTSAGGGGAGSGGGFGKYTYRASDLTSSVTVTVGAGGNGGAAATVTGNGNVGTSGGISLFGGYAHTNGGNPGAAGTTAAGGAGGVVPSSQVWGGAGGAGGFGNAAGGSGGATTATSMNGGGGGAGANSAFQTGGNTQIPVFGSNSNQALGGTTAGANGATGTQPVAAGVPSCGGGGGASAITGTAGTGGTAFYGGGGGGGGACSGGTSSGAGGNGGPGFVLVITYFS